MASLGVVRLSLGPQALPRLLVAEWAQAAVPLVKGGADEIAVDAYLVPLAAVVEARVEKGAALPVRREQVRAETPREVVAQKLHLGGGVGVVQHIVGLPDVVSRLSKRTYTRFDVARTTNVLMDTGAKAQAERDKETNTWSKKSGVCVNGAVCSAKKHRYGGLSAIVCAPMQSEFTPAVTFMVSKTHL